MQAANQTVAGWSNGIVLKMKSLKIECPYCKQRIEFHSSDAGAVINCPACGLSLPLKIPSVAVSQNPPPASGEIMRRNESFGGGCLVQLIGLLLIFSGVFTFGITAIFGIVLIIAGGKMSRKLACSKCGSVVASKKLAFARPVAVNSAESASPIDRGCVAEFSPASFPV